MKKKNEFEKHRHHLTGIRRAIVAKMQRVTDQGRDENLWSETADSGDMALSSYTKEFLYKLSDVERAQFVAIEAALRRIDDGTYGKCEDCGEEIPAKRLEAVPWAPRCTACQEVFEQQQEEQQQQAQAANF
ncbi:MAG TPA: TraR/DksA family transcriptional regulator [Acidobacteriota bacterium]